MHGLQAVEECVDILANRLYNGGRIKDKCEHVGVNERLIQIEKQFKGAAVLLHKMGYLPVAFRQLWSHERLLNVVEQFIGPDIAGEQNLSGHAMLITCTRVIIISTVVLQLFRPPGVEYPD